MYVRYISVVHPRHWIRNFSSAIYIVPVVLLSIIWNVPRWPIEASLKVGFQIYIYCFFFKLSIILQFTTQVRRTYLMPTCWIWICNSIIQSDRSITFEKKLKKSRQSWKCYNCACKLLLSINFTNIRSKNWMREFF